MDDGLLRKHKESINDAICHITGRMNNIYSDNAEDNQKLKDILLEFNKDNYDSIYPDPKLEKILRRIEYLFFKNMDIQNKALKDSEVRS